MSRNRKSDPKTHIVRPSISEIDPPEFTYCGKYLVSLNKCCVNSVEAASCTRCIGSQQISRRS